LVRVEVTDDVYAAIQREKQLKGWTRARKIALIEEDNPTWIDLSEDWQLDV
jgi:putative endonuclease